VATELLERAAGSERKRACSRQGWMAWKRRCEERRDEALERFDWLRGVVRCWFALQLAASGAAVLIC